MSIHVLTECYCSFSSSPLSWIQMGDVIYSIVLYNSLILTFSTSCGLQQSSAVDLKTKEEKDAELDRRIEALRKKNEALVKRYQVFCVFYAGFRAHITICLQFQTLVLTYSFRFLLLHYFTISLGKV